MEIQIELLSDVKIGTGGRDGELLPLIHLVTFQEFHINSDLLQLPFVEDTKSFDLSNVYSFAFKFTKSVEIIVFGGYFLK